MSVLRYERVNVFNLLQRTDQLIKLAPKKRFAKRKLRRASYSAIISKPLMRKSCGERIAVQNVVELSFEPRSVLRLTMTTTPFTTAL